MNTAVITVKTDQETKATAQVLAQELGLSLSGAVNALVKKFVRTRSLDVSLTDAKMGFTDYAKRELSRAEADRKAGRYYSFNQKESAITFLKDIGNGNSKIYHYGEH